MTDPVDDLLGAFETHSVEGIEAALAGGIDPGAPVRGKRVTTWLTEMYTRSNRFPACLRALLDRGATLDDPVLEPVLLDDAAGLEQAIDADSELVGHRTSMVSAFTSLSGATPLHVAAEYGSANAARVLIAHGADVDAAADVDIHGRGGHTPLFHTVNPHCNHSEPVLLQLLDAGARPDMLVPAILWGDGFEWETTFFDVTPVSYAQMGLLPQVHRDERTIYKNIELLLRAAGRKAPPLDNVPNRYANRRS